jgi:ATP-dependent Lhr-like helicase
VAECSAWLQADCGVNESAARQMIEYITAGRAVLGTVPTLDTIVAERFFDEGGGMQLILHAPFGGRINKAWGLALRKRFCRGFNFELQAAATDNGLNISLAEQHSFALSDVFEYLTEYTVKELLEQAALASPIFKARWRWDAGRSLQLIRFQNGKRVAPQIQRMRGDDLLASVFPQAAACFETIEGDIVIPDHALVREVMKDTLQEAMDLEGLKEVLRRMADGRIKCVAVDTTAPSVFCHELLNAAPYAYLDDADLQERRARAVKTRGSMAEDALRDPTRLDPAAIASVRAECWPDVRDEHELHDLLTTTVAMPVQMALDKEETRGWLVFFGRLRQQGRATIVTTIDANGEWREFWVPAERVAQARLVFAGRTLELSDGVREFDAGSETSDTARLKMMQGWAPLLGPMTSRDMERWFGVEAREWMKALLQMEMAGTMLRGKFEGPAVAADDLENVEWCERHLLQRIHRRTLNALRKQIEPVSAAEHLRWLLRWQHLAPRTQLGGEMGVLEALRGLAGFEAPAISWERELLTARVAGYDPAWLDALCLSGQVGWGRLSPHPALTEERAASAEPRAIVPTSVAPVTFFVREDADWMRAFEGVKRNADWKSCLSPAALAVLNVLTERGASFLADVMRFAKLEKAEAGRALWELAAAGLATADGFDNLRTLISPRAVRRGKSQPRKAGALGRWGLLGAGASEDVVMTAGEKDEALASACRMLLRRYGVMFRELLERESVAPKWRDLVAMLRRMEARGEVRGGRFVTGFSGEQYALPEALEGLRAMRGRGEMQERVVVAATDPLNLIGVTLPGERVSVMPGKTVTYAPGKEFGMVAELPAEAESGEGAADEAVVPGAVLPAVSTWTM